MIHSEIESLLLSKKIIVCCGTGGVGKTTVSAALALKAAILGRRAIVVTIDPAKRLATSLGMKELPNEPLDLTHTVNAKLVSIKQPKTLGTFSAVVPDSEKTFEALIRSLAGSDEGAVARVLKTSIYKIFTKEFSGAHEYMAMEKLYELSKLIDEGKTDLIILDTPPSANTRIFLDAPHMFAGFFDEKMSKILTAPGGKILAAGVEKVLSLLERLTGHGFLSDLVEFTKALFQLRSQFIDNLGRISMMLKSTDVAFLMVTSPERLTKADTQSFVQALKNEAYPFWGFIINRVLSFKLGVKEASKSIQPSWNEELQAKLTEQELASVIQAFEYLTPALKHESDALGFLKTLGRDIRVAQIPEQDNDVHSIEALYELTTHIG